MIASSCICVPSAYHPCTIRNSAYHPHTIRVPSAYHPRTIRVPSAYHPRTIRVPSAYHPRAIHVPSAFHPLTLCFRVGTRMVLGCKPSLTTEGPIRINLNAYVGGGANRRKGDMAAARRLASKFGNQFCRVEKGLSVNPGGYTIPRLYIACGSADRFQGHH